MRRFAGWKLQVFGCGLGFGPCFPRDRGCVFKYLPGSFRSGAFFLELVKATEGSGELAVECHFVTQQEFLGAAAVG